jgi:tetratricopeptide (TPR) repeat protein
LVIEPASDLEREIALTRLAIGAGQTALALTHANAARNLGPESAAASEALGYAAQSADDKPTMIAAFADAARQGSKDYLVHFMLGEQVHRAATNVGLGDVSGLDSKTARQIANRYERTINLRPSFLPAYQNLGAIIELVENSGAGDREFLGLGQKLFPGDGMIQLGLAVLDRKLGSAEESRRWLDGVLNSTASQPMHVASYASRLDDVWLYQDTKDRVQALASKGQYSEALAEIDRALSDHVSPSMRSDLVNNRRSLKASANMQAAKEAAENRNWEDVRRLLDEVVASDAPGMTKNAARRWLADLDKHNLRSK